MPFRFLNLFGCCGKQRKIKQDDRYYRFNDSITIDEIINNYEYYKGLPFIANYETKNNYYIITNFHSYDLKKYKLTKYKKQIMLKYIDKEDIIEVNEDNNEEICCPICYEEIKKTQKIVKMDICNHQYHEVCALKTLEHKEECPVCRANIYSDLQCIENEKARYDNISVDSYDSYMSYD